MRRLRGTAHEIRHELRGDDARDLHREEMRRTIEPTVRRHQLMDVPVDQHAVLEGPKML